MRGVKKEGSLEIYGVRRGYVEKMVWKIKEKKNMKIRLIVGSWTFNYE